VTHPELAKEADGWDPNSFTRGSHKRVKWKCEKGHGWEAAVKTRALSGNNCPVCSGHVVVVGFNDLKSKYPEIAKQAFEWDPSTVTHMSGKKEFWKCEKGHITEVKIASKVLSGGSCSICSGHKVSMGFNDLKTTHPELSKEADGWDPREISKGHDKKLAWKCEYGHKWEANVYSRTGKMQVGCPVCYGRKVQTGYNDLNTLFPLIAKEADGWDPKLVSAGNNEKFSWKCKEGHVWEMSPDQRTRRGSGCQVCSNNQLLVGYNDLSSTHPHMAKQAFGWDAKTVMAGSGKRLKWQCKLGHIWQAIVESRTSRNSECPYCANIKVLTGFNDLQSKFPKIAKESDGWNPENVIPGSKKKLNWKCPLEHTYSASPGSRTGKNQSSCPICAGKKVLAGFNDLESKYPEIARQAYNWDPATITSGSGKKLKWICSEKHIWSSSVSDRTGPHKSGCPSCSKYGFNPSADGFLYFVQHSDWEMLQIGITNVPDERLNDHRKLGWEVVEVRGPMDGHLTKQWETAILRMLKSKGADLSNSKIAGKFDGYSEAWSKSTFEAKSIKELMRLTEEFEDR
jgi:hypothetical protein